MAFVSEGVVIGEFDEGPIVEFFEKANLRDHFFNGLGAEFWGESHGRGAEFTGQGATTLRLHSEARIAFGI